MNHIGDVPATVIRGLLQAATTVQAQVEARLAPVGLSLPKLAALTAGFSADDAEQFRALVERIAQRAG